jgi:hypothetical protein
VILIQKLLAWVDQVLLEFLVVMVCAQILQVELLLVQLTLVVVVELVLVVQD